MAEKIAFIGLGQGLGRSVLKFLAAETTARSIFVLQRKEPLDLPDGALMTTHWQKCDLSQSDSLSTAATALKEWQPERLWFFAGGGPYGEFQNKKWSAHEWALQVGLLGLMKLSHDLLSQNVLKQMIVTGSLIADDRDPWASSYSASKAGLAAWVKSLQGESPNFDARLFRPTYFSGGLLPSPSLPERLQLVQRPDGLGQNFVRWALNPLFHSTNFALS